ncbi:hypothetical protein ACFL02_00505 [Planctomycetota bacterium]
MTRRSMRFQVTGRSRSRPRKMAPGSAPRIRKEHVGDERVREVGQVHSTEEAFEQGRPLYRHHLDISDLIIWIKKEITQKVRISITPATAGGVII